MTLNPISIATQGVYSNDKNIGLASKGYIDIVVVEIEIGNSGGPMDLGRLIENNNNIILMIVCDDLI